ncbi:Serine/threonine-protein phosphatase 7 long form-like [Vitis vinifera]|uniref:Serine/threonine-protein phosphatase 7 long form-like n=1 Tax=Vitis vinifera TaxID=29760 RepID=A0A438KKC6_VITVI|nr:Serine/threonine-protein phosphatase 7 long form-like [Vitis vinifera]
MEHREGRFDPDPLDRSILALQDRHRSQLMDSGIDMSTTFMDIHARVGDDPHIRRYVMQSGFDGVYRVGHISLDWPLITSLDERWRPETHTFHLPIGEMIVTLQDVAMILGLRIHGPPITGTCDIDWSLLCFELLGVVPPPSQIRGSSISARWLREQFSYPPAGVDDVILQRYARAFILALLVLAYLYRELCHASLDSVTEISGPIPLLQLWSWERLHVGRLDFGRPLVPIVVPHVHDDVVDGLHDHLLPNEALAIDPLGHKWIVPCLGLITHTTCVDILSRSIGCPDTGSGEDHRVHSTHEPSTSSGSSMRPPSLITPVRVPPIRGRGRGGRRAGHRHVLLASTLVQPSHPPVTSTFPLFQSSASLESPLSPPDVSIPAYSPRPETTIPSTLNPVQPSISLDAPPPIIESIAPPPVTESIAPPPVTKSIALLPFLQGTAHAARLHVRVPRGHRAPRVRRVLPPSVPSISTAHVDDVSQSIEMETFQIAQIDTTNMAIYCRCSQRMRKIPSCGTH